MMVIVNNTCVLGNSTDSCPAPGSSAGLAAGITLFFLLFGIIAAVLLYKYSSKIRTVVQFGERRTQKKEEDCAETRQVEPEHYTNLVREQSTAQTPIYENLTGLKAGDNSPAAKQNRRPPEPEEDLYLQCDSGSAGIYTNDLGDNSVLPESREEDVYIMPDA